MFFVVALLVGLIIAYSLVSQMIEDTILVKYKESTLEIHALDPELDHPFSHAIKQMSPIPYVALGDPLILDFKDLDVVSFEIKDYVLNDKGTIIFNDYEDDSIQVEGVNQAYYVRINKNMAALASSEINDKVIRGLEIVITETDKTSSFLLIIETDKY